MGFKDRKRPGPGTGYDVQMLRDFCGQLRWEVRINHAEHTHLQGQFNQELADALRPYLERRGCVLLVSDFVTADPSEAVTKQAIEVLHAYGARRSERWLAALDAIEDLLEEALACAAHPGTTPSRKMTARQVLAEFGVPPSE